MEVKPRTTFIYLFIFVVHCLAVLSFCSVVFVCSQILLSVNKTQMDALARQGDMAIIVMTQLSGYCLHLIVDNRRGM